MLEVSETGESVKTEGLVYEPNENDLYAVEEAVYQKSAHGGQVTAITVGPASARDVLYSAYARGVDQAVHVVDEKFRGSNPIFSLAAIAGFAKSAVPAYDLILTGVRADDDLMGQFGAQLSESLAIPMVTSVSGIDIGAGATTAKVQREIGNGYKQEIEVDLPCLVSIQFGIRPLQYTSINQLIKAKMRRIQSTTFDGPLGESTSDGFLTTLSAPPHGKECEIIEGSPSEAIAKLVQTVAKKGR